MAEIFVFGSNLAGRHGKGAALTAAKQYGAVRGVGHGPTGQAYALPTKDENLRTLSLEKIKDYAAMFFQYARANPHQVFRVTAIGTGLAGYKHTDIAPMFVLAPENCRLPIEWVGLVDHPSLEKR